MAFKIEERFEVQAPVERVWKYLIDPKSVVECLPGAELLEQQDEHTFLGAIKVKVGPLSMSYKGQAKLTEINEETHQVRMVGDAREIANEHHQRKTLEPAPRISAMRNRSQPSSAAALARSLVPDPRRYRC